MMRKKRKKEGVAKIGKVQANRGRGREGDNQVEEKRRKNGKGSGSDK